MLTVTTGKKQKYNYSIAFIKVFMSFCVICCHFWATGDPSLYPVSMMHRMRDVAAPVFILVSFLLTYKMYLEPQLPKLRQRLFRLLVPYFTWGVIYYFGCLLVGVILSRIRIENEFVIRFTKKDLMWQLLFGCDRYLAPQFWYQFNLVVFMVLFWLLFRFVKKGAKFILIALFVLALVSEYTGLNYYLFARFEYEIWWPTGRLTELLPCAVAGFFLSDTGVMKTLRKYSLVTAPGCIFLMLLFSYVIRIPAPEYGFGYSGIYILIYTVLAFVLLYVLPFDRLPSAALAVLKFLAKYSFGVYCIHYLLGRIWSDIICVSNGWTRDTFMSCVLIYAASVLLSWAISLIPGKFPKMLVE